MAIGLKVRKGKFRFTAICDVCGKPIENTAKAYVLWKDHDNDNDVIIIHQFDCDLPPYRKGYPLSLPLYYALEESVKSTPRNKREIS